jgi:hypothetical protein
MTENDRKIIKDLVRAGKFDDEIIGFLAEKRAVDTKRMIAEMGSKYCLHPTHSPKKGTYGI